MTEDTGFGGSAAVRATPPDNLAEVRRIAVADAPLPKRSDLRPARPAETSTADEKPRWPFILLLGWLLIMAAQVFYWQDEGIVTRILVYARLAMWPVIVAFAFLHVGQKGTGDLIRGAGFLLPYLVLGLTASILGFSPYASLRPIVFWVLAITAAAMLGSELPPRMAMRLLFWAFFLMIAGSLAMAILKPGTGIVADTRTETGGAWRGLFPAKNLLGLICVYALLFTMFARDIGRVLRLACVALALVVLVGSGSQAAVLAAVALIGFVTLVTLLLRTSISTGARVTLLALAMIAGILIMFFAATTILELLGRDATLTGRTVVWPAWLERASYFWLTGAGPGSFTGPSPITFDLTLRFSSYGQIYTPHNMFIAVFGETGLFGLLAFTLPLLYFAFVLPFTSDSRYALPTAAVAFTMIVGGLGETREVFGLGLNMFLLVFVHALMRQQPGPDEQAAVPSSTVTPDPPGLRVLGA